MDTTTDPDGLVVFDTASGISIEEQQEILAGINAMTAGSRLASGAELPRANKRGLLFPMSVNIGALVLLALGLALLFLFHGQDEQGIRESSAALGSTERKLIQEIRQETNRQISEKENEINDILLRLQAASSEYQGLQASMESLTEEEKERAAYLLQMQDEYNSALSSLQDERNNIIEDSRLREANLRVRADEGGADYGEAMEELRRLGSEQERADRVESQMVAYYAAENDQIMAGRLDDASGTLRSMKEFLNAPSFQGSRSLEAKKQIHLTAIAALESALNEAGRQGESGAPLQAAVPSQRDDSADALAAMNARYAVLEQKAAGLEQALAASSSQGSDQGKLISEYLKEIDSLRTANVNQQETLNRRDADIVRLRGESETREQNLSSLNASIAELRRQNADLQAEYDTLQRRMDAAIKAFTGE